MICIKINIYMQFQNEGQSLLKMGLWIIFAVLFQNDREFWTNGRSIMFVTWPSNFTYGCTGQSQEHISSYTPFLHISLKINTQSVHTMIV